MGSALLAALTMLSDRRWHSIHELVGVAGLRASGRIHDLRRGADCEGRVRRRILCRMEGATSHYRWVCDCGPTAAHLADEPQWCDACRAAIFELADARGES